MKALKAFAIGFGIGIVMIMIAMIAVSFMYKDKLTGYLISKINKNINTEYSIGTINFTMLKKFPNATLELTDIRVMGTKKYRFSKLYRNDTLFYAHKLFLQFNIFNLLKNDFVISKVHLDQGKLCVLVNSRGQVNYDILKKTESNGEAISVDLENLKITRTDLIFYNEAKKMLIHTDINNIKMSGNFGADNYTITSGSELYVKDLQLDNLSLIKNSLTELFLDFSVQKNLYDITQGELRFKGQTFEISGILNAGKDVDMNLEMKGKNLSINELIRTLPDSVVENLGLDATGDMFFTAKAKGIWNVTQYPHITARFGIENGEFTRNGITVSGMSFEGKFNNGKENSLETSALFLKNIKFAIEEEKISGQLYIENLKKPMISAQADASFYLQKLNQFLKIKDLSEEQGKIGAKFKVKCKLNKLNDITKNDIKIKKIEGQVHLDDIGFCWKESKNKFTGIHGTISLGDKILLDHINVNLGNNQLSMNGVMYNSFNSFFNNEIFAMEGDISCKYLDYDEVMAVVFAGSSPDDPVVYPDSIELDFNVNVNTLKWGGFICNDLKGHVNYKPRTFLFDSVTMKAMEGSLTGKGMLMQDSKNDITFRVSTVAEGINISKVFASFNNFGQDVMQDKHLKGTMKGTVNFSSKWNNKLVLYQDKVDADAAIEIKNGELIDYRPMLALSKFVDVAELKHIKFADLKNVIYIKNRVISIPQMDISSNAFSISISGTHDFDNKYEYHLKVALSDVLWGKAEKKKSDINDYTEEEETGHKTLPIVITGKGEDYKIGYDRRKAREDFSKKMIAEKKELKSILFSELGMFSNDSSNLKQKQESVVTKKFSIDWDETVKEQKDSVKSTVGDQHTNSTHHQVEWEDN